MQTIEDIAKTIMADSENQEFTEQGIKPLFAAPKNARINIVLSFWILCGFAHGFLFSGAWEVWRFTTS